MAKWTSNYFISCNYNNEIKRVLDKIMISYCSFNRNPMKPKLRTPENGKGQETNENPSVPLENSRGTFIFESTLFRSILLQLIYSFATLVPCHKWLQVKLKIKHAYVLKQYSNHLTQT